MSLSKTLEAMGLTLPPVATPVGSYVPALKAGSLIFVSGQLPIADGTLQAVGKVGDTVDLATAVDAAKMAALNALAAAAEAAGGLDTIRRVVQLRVYVNSAPGFTDQAKVANGASDFLGELCGEPGRHVRAAVGVSDLPLNAALEIELVVSTEAD